MTSYCVWSATSLFERHWVTLCVQKKNCSRTSSSSWSSTELLAPIRAQTAIEWACAPAPGRGPSGEASRLKVVRRFLSHLQAFEFETEVPGPGVLPAFRRPLPYLYSSDEIAALMKEASHLGPKDSLRPYTYVALIGLLASSGLRVGEALRLKVEEVRLSCSHPHLQVVPNQIPQVTSGSFAPLQR